MLKSLGGNILDILSKGRKEKYFQLLNYKMQTVVSLLAQFYNSMQYLCKRSFLIIGNSTYILQFVCR